MLHNASTCLLYIRLWSMALMTKSKLRYLIFACFSGTNRVRSYRAITQKQVNLANFSIFWNALNGYPYLQNPLVNKTTYHNPVGWVLNFQHCPSESWPNWRNRTVLFLIKGDRYRRWEIVSDDGKDNQICFSSKRPYYSRPRARPTIMDLYL